MSEQSTLGHRTVAMAIKTANVDEGIIPLVAFLNSSPEVCTLYSCEGVDAPADEQLEGLEADPVLTTRARVSPYVTFRCGEPVVLARILHLLGSAPNSRCEVDWRDGMLRYTIYFGNRASLRRWIQWLDGAGCLERGL